MSKKAVNMGLGELGKNIIFPMQFRFILSSKSLNLQYHAQEANISYSDKTLNLKLIEYINADTNQDCPIDNWIQNLLKTENKEQLSVLCVDGFGQEIYKITFYGVKLKEHLMPFSYESSMVVTHSLVISFEKSKRVYLRKAMSEKTLSQ